MPNWLVSAHGNIEHSAARRGGRSHLKGADKAQVPAGMEVVFYCPGDRQLSMNAGWKLWDMLMFGENGGEAAAYSARYSLKRAYESTSNYYAYLDLADPWDDGPAARGNAHPTQSAYGVWRVGNPTAPVINLLYQPDNTMQLSQILTAASANGAVRVYWGCCRAHVLDFGMPTERNTNRSDKTPYTPSRLI